MCKYLREKNNTKPIQTFPENRKGILSNLCYKAIITLILKSNIVITRKENYSPVSLINTGAKNYFKELANRIQQYIREQYIKTKWFAPGI